MISLALIVGVAQAQIFQAARDGTPDNVRSALAAGADVNARDEYGQTPLMYAAGQNADPHVIQALLTAGAEVNARSLAGWSPLFYAARSSSEAVVLMLLEAEAYPAVRNDVGESVLSYAVRNTSLVGTEALARLAMMVGELELFDSERHGWIVEGPERLTPLEIKLLGVGPLAQRGVDCTDATEYWEILDTRVRGSFTAPGRDQVALGVRLPRCDYMDARYPRQELLIYEGEKVLARAEHRSGVTRVVDVNLDGIDELVFEVIATGQGALEVSAELASFAGGEYTVIEAFPFLAGSSCGAYPEGLGLKEEASVTYAPRSGEMPSFTVSQRVMGCRGQNEAEARAELAAFLASTEGPAEQTVNAAHVPSAADVETPSVISTTEADDRFVVIDGERLEKVRAYRDLYFGDSATLVKAKLAADPEVRASGSWGGPTYQVDIAGITYLLDFRFYDNRLMKVVLKGVGSFLEPFDAPVAELNTLVEVITRSQGEPNRTYEVRWDGLTQDTIEFSHLWTVDPVVWHRAGYTLGDWYLPEAQLWIEWRPGTALAAAAAKLEQDAADRARSKAIEDAAGDF